MYINKKNISYFAIVFEHELTSETLKCLKTNYSNDFNFANGEGRSRVNEHHEESIESFKSKIVSIQTLNGWINDIFCVVKCLKKSALN